MAVRRAEDARKLVLGFAYLAYDRNDKSPLRKVWNLSEHCHSTRRKMDILLKCDANTHHSEWVSSDMNIRGESLLEYIICNNLEAANSGNKLNYINVRKKEVIDITIGTAIAYRLIKIGMCQMSHRYLIIDIFIST